MPEHWSHHHPTKIFAGQGSLNLLAKLVKDSPWLLVTSQGFTKRGLPDRIRSLVAPISLEVHDQITPNPDLDYLSSLVDTYRVQPIAGIIALGGGSALDAGKVLSAALPGKQNLADTLRRNNNLESLSPLPVITIPTTSGTGAEVTPFATVWDKSNHRKFSVAGDHVYPAMAILDPKLCLTLPPEETLHTGLDTISHALESLWNKNRTPVSETFAWKALELATVALPKILQLPQDIEQREMMQQASVFAGLAISDTRTAIAHSISYPLTLHYGVPHGLACSFTLPRLIDAWLSEADLPTDRSVLLKSVKSLLLDLKLDHLLKKYLTPQQAQQLRNEMITPGRADNYALSREIDIGYLLEGESTHATTK